MGKEKLIEIVFKSLCNHIHKSCKLAENIADDLIANDVVPVVRCKDCDNTCPGNNGLVCTIWGCGTYPDSYCSYGERKDNDQK